MCLALPDTAQEHYRHACGATRKQRPLQGAVLLIR